MPGPRRTPQARTATVIRTERITPHMIRVWLTGDALAGFGAGEFSDHYVKLCFPQAGVDYPDPLDLGAIRQTMPRELWPRVRTYTVRSWDPATLELAIDFVHHGDEGIAGPWADAARPGDQLTMQGPGGAYLPDPAAGWHLLIGDESALPAIGASLERLPLGAQARVFIEVSGPEEEQKLTTDGLAEIVWIHRGGAVVGEKLVEAVRAAVPAFPAGDLQAFVHGEATFVKDLRRLLKLELGVPMERLSISGYWRRGADEDGWQSSKAEWNRRVEEEEAAVAAG
jgi:NADPH-dependent ferric siderophore reductase